MNVNPASPSVLIPASERVRRMGEKLDVLEAGLPRAYSRVPGLVWVLMRFFAALRRLLDGMAEGGASPEGGSEVPAGRPDVPADVDATLVVEVAEFVAGGARRVRRSRRVLRVRGVAQAVVAPVGAVVWPVEIVWAVGAGAVVAWRLGAIFSKFSNSDLAATPSHVHIIALSK